ncbi:Tn3 family transposase [Streptomyces sp. NPDC047000]|uniref:Tn3 family transposase n=1 Tax=Streptomyces sp. NPDC047000 TaxID=3155474 RepID=UPI0033CC945F
MHCVHTLPEPGRPPRLRASPAFRTDRNHATAPVGALGLMLNIVILWNTVYLQQIIAEMRAEEHHIRDEDVARLSPLMFAHINFHGRYSFALPAEVRGGRLRATRKPADASVRSAPPGTLAAWASRYRTFSYDSPVWLPICRSPQPPALAAAIPSSSAAFVTSSRACRS